MIDSFRPLTGREKVTGTSHTLHYIQVPRGATFASLASSAKIPDAENQLRLINGYYPTASRAREIGLKSSADPLARRSTTDVALFCIATVYHAVVFTLVAAPARAELVVYTAELIRTMEPALPTATAVAVEDGLIVAVGSEDTLQPSLRPVMAGSIVNLPMTFYYRGSSIRTSTLPCPRC